MIVHRSNDRGSFTNDWLNAKFSFEFGSYINPERRNYSDLLVLNDDVMQPASGFSEHWHANVEVMSYPLSGEVEHKDSIGNCQTIKYGDVHLMRAGRGISHSEINNSHTEVEHHVQWWIKPKSLQSEPAYQCLNFTPEHKAGRLCLIASDDIKDNVLWVDQDIKIYASILTSSHLEWRTHDRRRAYLHVLTGSTYISSIGLQLDAGDSISLQPGEILLMNSINNAEILIFDLR